MLSWSKPRVGKRISSEAIACGIGTFVFALFGGFIFPWIWWSEGRVDAMQAWPTAEAVIESASVSSEYRRPVGTIFGHRLQYRFTVAGNTFVGQRLSYGGAPPSWSTEAHARRQLPPFGSKIVIRYNPREPSDSVVHVIRSTPGERGGLKWIAGGLGLAGGILMVAAGRAWRRKIREAPVPDPST